MSEWKRYTTTTVTSIYRSGWRGVWDALVSAVTRKPRLTVETPLTFSVWAKHNEDKEPVLILQAEAGTVATPYIGGSDEQTTDRTC